MKKIIIIDDVEANLRVLWRLINREGTYEIDAFTDPQEAVLKIKETQYDYILTDYMMPYISGEQIVEEARNSVTNKDTKIAIISAYSEDSVIGSLIVRYDNVTVIPKPINKNILYEFLKE